MKKWHEAAVVPTAPATHEDHPREGTDMLKDLAGTADLQTALVTTNRLLAEVLAELKETNGVRLEAVEAQLRQLNESGVTR